MSSWKIIKESLTKDTIAGSVGYQNAINNASSLFIRLRETLIDKDSATDEFNYDSDVTHALLNKEFLESLK